MFVEIFDLENYVCSLKVVNNVCLRRLNFLTSLLIIAMIFTDPVGSNSASKKKKCF